MAMLKRLFYFATWKDLCILHSTGYILISGCPMNVSNAPWNVLKICPYQYKIDGNCHRTKQGSYLESRGV